MSNNDQHSYKKLHTSRLQTIPQVFSVAPALCLVSEGVVFGGLLILVPVMGHDDLIIRLSLSESRLDGVVTKRTLSLCIFCEKLDLGLFNWIVE